ncbi:MAG: hypothetical protein ACP5OU_00450 [Methanothrix sp.]
MKWLGNIFGRNRALEERSSLRLEEIDSWLSEREESDGFGERLDEIYGRMDKAARSLSQNIASLNSADADESTPPKLLRSGLAARGEVTKQLLSLSEKLQPPKKRDLDGSFQHQWAALKSLERSATTFSRAQRYVAALFPKSIEKINSDLAEISRILLGLEQEIGKRRKFSEESWYSRELAERLQQALPRIEDRKKKALEDERALSELSSKILALEDEAKRHSQSEDARAAEEMKGVLERAEAERSRAEEELADLISPLSKALARIAKQGAISKISLQHEKVFDELLKAPESVGDEEITGALKELQSHLSHLGLKDRKKEKTLDHIDLLICNRSLENARARRAVAEKEMHETEVALKECSREARRLREEIALAKKSYKSLEAGLMQDRRELALAMEKAESDEKELAERIAKIAGRPIDLDLSREG